MAKRQCAAAIGLIALFGAGGYAQKPGATHVGVMRRVFHPAEPVRNWRGEADHALHAVIWYPAPGTAVESPQVVGPASAPLFEAGSAAQDAPLATPKKGGLPLVLLSHGTG